MKRIFILYRNWNKSDLYAVHDTPRHFLLAMVMKVIFRLDLRNNDVTLGGLMALSLAARENKSLTRIDLDKPPKDNTLPIELIVSIEKLKKKFSKILEKKF